MSKGGSHSEGLPAAGPVQPGDPAEAEARQEVGRQQIVTFLRRRSELGRSHSGRRSVGRQQRWQLRK